MTIREKLESFLGETFISEDGEECKIELKPGLTDEEIDQLSSRLPGGQLSVQVKDLLRFARGFDFYNLFDVTFDGINEFGLENIFPSSVQLAHDGFGNFWVLDIDSKGNWGEVFFVCHDPAVIVKNSDDLSQFIQHIYESGKDMEHSHINIIHEKRVFEIAKNKEGLISLQDAKDSEDFILSNFAGTLPGNFMLADLRNKPNGAGFAWGKFGVDIDTGVRCGDELIWGIEKPEKKSFFKKLFG